MESSFHLIPLIKQLSALAVIGLTPRAIFSKALSTHLDIKVDGQICRTAKQVEWQAVLKT